MTGTKLKSTCSPCVAAVCAAIPGCCTGAWSTACVAEVANCDGACGCQVEESTFGGSCYWRNTSSTKWPNAQTTCSGRGPGWDLTGIGSDPENEHVKLNAALGEEVWIGLTDRSPYSPTVGEWRWVSGDPTGFWEESAPDPSFYENWALGEPDDTNRYARMESSGDWDARKSTEKAK